MSASEDGGRRYNTLRRFPAGFVSADEDAAKRGKLIERAVDPGAEVSITITAPLPMRPDYLKVWGGRWDLVSLFDGFDELVTEPISCDRFAKLDASKGPSFPKLPAFDEGSSFVMRFVNRDDVPRVLWGAWVCTIATRTP
jgi:hypothetical protein